MDNFFIDEGFNHFGTTAKGQWVRNQHIVLMRLKGYTFDRISRELNTVSSGRCAQIYAKVARMAKHPKRVDKIRTSEIYKGLLQ